jgi:hypothetical protein
MLTLICSAIYPDGQSVVGTIRARSAKNRCPIKYKGPVKRMGNMPAWATPAAMELLFATAIHRGEVGGGVCATGEYEYGPKYVPDDRLMYVQRHRERYKKN